jgi:hypothetical protein
MNRAVRLAIVGFALVGQLLFLGSCDPHPHGAIVDVRYRRKERLAAYLDYNLHPSPATRAVLNAELTRMKRYEWLILSVLLGTLVAANGMGIYYVLGSGYKKWGA